MGQVRTADAESGPGEVVLSKEAHDILSRAKYKMRARRYPPPPLPSSDMFKDLRYGLGSSYYVSRVVMSVFVNKEPMFDAPTTIENTACDTIPDRSSCLPQGVCRTCACSPAPGLSPYPALFGSNVSLSLEEKSVSCGWTNYPRCSLCV